MTELTNAERSELNALRLKCQALKDCLGPFVLTGAKMEAAGKLASESVKAKLNKARHALAMKEIQP